MLTFILNVLGEVLGIGNLYCRPFYSAGSGPCARPRNFENRLLNDVLSKLLTFFSASDPGTDLYGTSGRRAKRQRPTGHRLRPAPSSIMAAPASEDFTPPPGTHDRSNVETGERRDMYTLTFFNRF